jgi:hypothetical protein
VDTVKKVEYEGHPYEVFENGEVHGWTYTLEGFMIWRRLDDRRTDAAHVQKMDAIRELAAH